MLSGKEFCIVQEFEPFVRDILYCEHALTLWILRKYCLLQFISYTFYCVVITLCDIDVSVNVEFLFERFLDLLWSSVLVLCWKYT